jgi:glutamate dehydrogenase
MLTALHNTIMDRNTPTQAAVLSRFADIYYANAPVDEWLVRPIADVYGATLSSWHFIQQRQANEVKVRVFNPDHENHGWQSLHTVVEVVCQDMPFLVDSVRMQLNAHQMSLHTIQYCVLHATRDHDGHLNTESDWSQPGQGKVAEAIIYIEFDHHSDKAVLQHLTESLHSVLEEVRCCVDSFAAITQRLHVVSDHLASVQVEGAEEGLAFLQWLEKGHFTFLASDEFHFEQKGDDRFVVRDSEQGLGSFLFRNKTDRTRLKLHDLSDEIQEFITGRCPVSFMKSGVRSRVHRPVYPDYVVVKRYNDDGEVIGGVRFMGLYTSMVYIESPNNIPIVRNKLAQVRAQAGFDAGSHSGKELDRILEVYPRDELFQSSAEQLYKTAISILNIQERRQTRVYLRRDTYSKFVSCLVYVPRDIYNTELRQRIEGVLQAEFEPQDIESTTYFSESVLARAQYTLRLDPERDNSFDDARVSRKIRQVVRSWPDDLHDALIEQVGEELGNRQYHTYRTAFPAGYRESFGARTAVADIQHMESLLKQQPGQLSMSFYRQLEENGDHLRFKLFHRGSILPLSDVIPVLENLGLRVLGEHPYEIVCQNGEVVWIHNFLLQYTLADSISITDVKNLFQDSFRATWEGRSENDAFNRLVLGAQMDWKDIALLRAYARYMKQIRFGISESYIAETLCRYIPLSTLLVKLFHSRFGLDQDGAEQRETDTGRIEQQILDSLDDVRQLNEDRTIRRYCELIKATLRTNFFQLDDDGQTKPYIALKMNPDLIGDMPLPKPMFEIFVYSPVVEGVHLRGGKVARGGLRWSDRIDDFRTEVLGLVKAQQVKNAVIVPVGAKGGFVAKQLPKDGGRDAVMAEGIRCYKIFVSALLDVTDNLVEGQPCSPEGVVCHDGNDPYLVVAADKGTATFSDIANEIAVSRGFWMGDAFASGGSIGYDHKKMGITARGAWVSVQRHFRERGHNVQEQDVTVVGIGDMAGDVFGNGMLQSEHICLVAAFNHMHVFIDPTPDAKASFAERKRLFELPRSSWADYNSQLISKGGGVFLRSAKSIAISLPMKQRFGITQDRMAPNDLIRVLLKAPVDLLWNGGIGTYIKASSERHSEVGDKANDSLRIDGKEVRAKVIGEGGNLGVTQLGRIEFAEQGGASYTDFIDNAGGVDCSDHEVNIKIMLNEVLDNGDLTRKQRNAIFMELTDDVAELVLANNYRQTQAISLAYKDCMTRLDEYSRLMKAYESQGKLNRALEFLPDDDQLNERKNSGSGLTLPELSVLISYTKADLKEQLNCPDIYADPYVAEILTTAFPQALDKRFGEQLGRHRLHQEIIATQLANDMVNYMGITFMHRLHKSTGASIADIARAYVAARDIFALEKHWLQINELDYQIGTDIQEDMMAELMRLVRRATRWFLRNRRSTIDIANEVAAFGPAVEDIAANLGDILRGSSLERWQRSYQARVDRGVPQSLASYTVGAINLYSALGIIEAATETDRTFAEVAAAYFDIGEHLSLNWVGQQINTLPTNSHWEALARESLRDDLDWQQRSLTIAILASKTADETLMEALQRWQGEQALMFGRWQGMLAELQSADVVEFAMLTVALRELLDLAEVSRIQYGDRTDNESARVVSGDKLSGDESTVNNTGA